MVVCIVVFVLALVLFLCEESLVLAVDMLVLIVEGLVRVDAMLSSDVVEVSSVIGCADVLDDLNVCVSPECVSVSDFGNMCVC